MRKGLPLLQCIALAAVTLAAGCGLGQSPADGVVGMSGRAQSAARALLGPRGRSWIDPDNGHQRLLYLTTEGSGVVILKYPSLTIAGNLTGFFSALGECVDRAHRDVFVTNQESDPQFPSTILGFHHGATTPFVILNDGGYAPNACAFDPTSNTLAVANGSPGPGSVAIYTNPNAAGSPTYITSPGIGNIQFLGYDPSGNLWLDGYSGFNFQYAEIPHSNPTQIVLKTVSAPITRAGGVLWDGHYMTVGDVVSGTIYRLNPNGSVQGTTQLDPGAGTEGVEQYFFQGNVVVAPNSYLDAWKFYRYPSGVPINSYGSTLESFGSAVIR